MFDLNESSFFSFPKDENRKNQDAILPPKKLDDGFLFAVADGVGSYAGGAEAAKKVINVLDSIENRSELDNLDFIFKRMRDEVSGLSDISPEMENAATTLTFCYVDHCGAIVAHVGDCRCYYMVNNKLNQITKDHTRYQSLLDEGIFTKKYLSDKRAKNILTTAISKNVPMNYDVFFIDRLDCFFDNKAMFFIMSDGAHRVWDRRARFENTTMGSVIKFSNSFYRRFERYEPEDDYSFIGASFLDK